MITLNLISKYLNDWWLNVHSKIHNPKSAYLFLYLFTNKILFKKKLFILLFYYIIYRICKLFSVIHFLYSYICGPYICNLNMWHNLSSDSPLCFVFDEAHHLLPHPSPLLHTSLTITQDLQPHWVLCFSFDITKYLCLFSVTQYSWRSQRWVGDVGWDYSINGKQTIWYISKG